MIDLFGTKPSFNYNNRETSKSSCGVFATYSFLIFTFWALYQVGNDIFFKRNPKTIQNEEFIENPEPMNLSPDTFNLAFGLQNPITFAHYIDERIFKVVATWQQLMRVPDDSGNVNFVSNAKVLELERCTPEHFGAISESAKTIELPYLHCFKKEDKELLRLQGRFESPVYEHITVDYSPCKNGSSVVCAPQEEIDALLDGAYFAVYFTDLAILPHNFSNPESRFLDSKFTTIGKSYYKEYSFFTRHINVKNDIGWLFSEYHNQDYVSFDRIQENIDFRHFENFFRFVIRVSTMKTFWSRSYIKIQDILAELDGLVTLFIIVIALVVHPYIKSKYFEELINEVFDVKIYRLDKDKKKEEPSSPSKVVRRPRHRTPNYQKAKTIRDSKNDLEDPGSAKPLRKSFHVVQVNSETNTGSDTPSK